ncbi:hypothetical protein N7468_005646 [Penicillium chermesinum]|uniref:FAD-binding domain-containing protein n=1 Tax=Penicillium chermesinum TaxID=63820 RepID=A0A9W9TN65_9EURO|nr:uncharacterized protein N7468_005646 [Penicillium chermesinum]KAJ5232690.1 hypothetical protein N7468_005646 [Penicillium chermesinum]KAJ6172349.1 hypothetical protein N7470_001416 [Penicillium chermesinum]
MLRQASKFLCPLHRGTYSPQIRRIAAAAKPAPVAIVGGGPCGLTFARLLERAGVDYVVFERDASFTAAQKFQGGTLDLGPEGGQAALKSAGLFTEFQKYARYEGSCLTIQDFKGNHYERMGGDDRDRPEIDRFQLRQMLLQSIPEQRVKWNMKLLGAEIQKREQDSGSTSAADCVLRFEDGTSERGFRLVVGSDGAWSKLRQVITPMEPTYTGRLFIEGAISPGNPQYNAAVALAGPGNSLATGNHQALCVQQMSDRSYRVYMAVEGPESMTRPGGQLDLSNQEETCGRINELYSPWAPHLRDIVAAVEGPYRAWPLFQLDERLFARAEENKNDLPHEERWKRVPGVTLLGDAAHVGVPNGEGVNHAMTDARKLFECLEAELKEAGEGFDQKADAVRIERAISAYEADMFPRAHESIRDGIGMMGMMFAKDGAKKMKEILAQTPQDAQT